MADARQQRAAENEVLSRQVNETIEESQPPGGKDSTAEFLCECAYQYCTHLLKLTPREYDRIHAHPRRFIVLSGHEDPDVETVVETQAGYLIVEKRGEAGEQAEAMSSPEEGGD
jgi:hypothetical protein